MRNGGRHIRSSKQIPQQKEIASNSFSVASFICPLPKKFSTKYFSGAPYFRCALLMCRKRCSDAA